MENYVELVKTILREIKGTASEAISKKLEIGKCERIVDKVGSFSDNCEDCQQHLLEMKDYFIQMEGNRERLEETDFKQHKELLNRMTSHLQKKHQMVTEGFYLAVFMSIGMSLGVAFGLTIFDNIGLGIPIGMSIGIALGAGLDADAKKKGKTI